MPVPWETLLPFGLVIAVRTIEIHRTDPKQSKSIHPTNNLSVPPHRCSPSPAPVCRRFHTLPKAISPEDTIQIFGIIKVNNGHLPPSLTHILPETSLTNHIQPFLLSSSDETGSAPYKYP
ncbi:hypothetical protein TWF225_004096 [Orbilia oligospora]|uniref:Uncharacterized protein n=1 Tax=Orbilia oligospora TaxID=2813651 RepID=A0A7C8KHG5_ORBOL|nr:hypothetical protein TWF751_004835 [Orbilia oligospora]KAF3187881.1 hypothetical protein TWF225_004096 [Orbilia oligospora]KAF3248156.1 hypothetical protein TWF128_008504 [Orbilia oligospora]KAF3257764.1 hypothetical protein TWF217_005873 [Orbilia oligospora]KAF3283984.1 hypothetical protein TWF132_009878 [Orbilia oligospora]